MIYRNVTLGVYCVILLAFFGGCRAEERWAGLTYQWERFYGWFSNPVRWLLLALIRIGFSLIIMLMALGHILDVFEIDIFIMILSIAFFLVWFGPSLMRHVAVFEFAGVKITTKDLRPIEERAEEAGIIDAGQTPSVPVIPSEERTAVVVETDPELGNDEAASEVPKVPLMDREVARERTRSMADKHEFPLFLQFSDSDSNVQLTLLRREIEMELRKLAERADVPVDRGGTTFLARNLARLGVLDDLEASVIVDLTRILNQAVHGVPVDDLAAQRALTLGEGILYSIRGKRH